MKLLNKLVLKRQNFMKRIHLNVIQTLNTQNINDVIINFSVYSIDNYD